MPSGPTQPCPLCEQVSVSLEETALMMNGEWKMWRCHNCGQYWSAAQLDELNGTDLFQEEEMLW